MSETVIVETVTAESVTSPIIETVVVETRIVETMGQRGPTGLTGPIGPQGLQGIQGPAGPAGGSIPQFTAGENLSGHRAIRLSGGLAYYCDAATLAHAGTAIGITTGAALSGDLANMQTLGIISDPSWNFVNGPVYVGSAGVLTQVPNGVFVQQIGVSGKSTELNIAPQLAVLRN
jgi:hypothetical protein